MDLNLGPSSLSGNPHRRLCFRIMAMSFRDWSAHVRSCPPLSAFIVTQLVTRPLKHLIRRDPRVHPATSSYAVALLEGKVAAHSLKVYGEDLWSI